MLLHDSSIVLWNSFSMQRVVTLSSSSSYHQSLVPSSSSVLSPAVWNGLCDGPVAAAVPFRLRCCSKDYASPLPSTKGEKFSFDVLRCRVGGQEPCRRIFFPTLSVNGDPGIRNRSVSRRGSLGNRVPDPDNHHDRQRGGNHRSFSQVADSIRDYASESWWTHEDLDEDEDYRSSPETVGSSVSTELWTSRIIIQLSLFWNLLGYSPSKIDEWLVSIQGRKRLTTNRKRFSDVSRRVPSALNNRMLGDLFSAGESLESLQKKLFSSGFSKFVSPGYSFRAREKIGTAFDGFQDLGFFQWLSQMRTTYGLSFMLLVALGYATQGFRCFPWFAVGYMLKDGLQVDPGTMQFLLSSAALPMVAKPIYGIISDTIYIRGAHRLPYLVIAGILQVISWGALALWPETTSSAVILTVALTLGNLGAAIADVMNDALVAEAGKKQKGSAKGELQSFAWLVMASGGVLGNLLGGFAFKRVELTTMFLIFLGLITLHLLTCLFVSEQSLDLAPPLQLAAVTPSPRKEDTSGLQRRKTHGSKSSSKDVIATPGLYSQLRDQVKLLAQLLKKKEISRTLLWFCASYAMVPVLGSSIFFYQTQVLQIDPTFIGFARVVGQLGLMVGSQLYNGALKGLPLRRLLGCVQLLLSCCMLSDLLLVNRVNLMIGIRDEFFVLGASALVDCVSQFKVLPVMVRLGQLCPQGSEGSLMAFFSSCACLAGLCSGYFGVALANYLHISARSFEGLPLGIFIQAMFALLPILFISIIPSAEESPKVEEPLEKKLR